MIYIPFGVLCYETNNLDLAKKYLAKGLEASKRLGLIYTSGGYAERALARVFYVMGEKKTAFSLLREARQDIDRSVFPLPAFWYDALEADFRTQATAEVLLIIH